MKYFASVVVSVLLSVSAILGLVHYTPSTDTAGYAQLRDATWRIDISSDLSPVGSCSGTFIDEHIMLTAAHCDVYPGVSFKVGNEKAIILKKDSTKDLMLLVVPHSHTYVAVGSGAPKIDAKVVAVGYPYGVAQYLTEGRVQGYVTLPPEMELETGPLPKFLAVSSLVSPGNSGGGLFYKLPDGSYVLVGVVSRGGGTVTLAVHPDEIVSFLGS